MLGLHTIKHISVEPLEVQSLGTLTGPKKSLTLIHYFLQDKKYWSICQMDNLHK